MVNGLATFKKHFADYTGSYILIGDRRAKPISHVSKCRFVPHAILI